MEKEGHPRLRRKRREATKYTHGFSEHEMGSLASICDALLPSLNPPHSSSLPTPFFTTSASQNPIPHEVAEIVKERGLGEARVLVRVILWLLSTRVGTFLLCGSPCVGKKMPFVTKFAHLPTRTRERILLGWSRSRYFFFLRLFFYFVKSLCLFAFVSHFDEQSNTSPAWEAMGYKPDECTSAHPAKASDPRPLEPGIVETLYESPDTLPHSLAQKGLRVTQDDENDLYKVQCDVVIVGSGCGGAVAAAVLSASGHKVVVLEKGNYYTAPDYSLLEKPSMDELLEKGGMFATTDGSLMLMAASAVGGGSVVNWSAAIKTPEGVLEEWAEEGRLSLFGSPRYARAMDAVCERIGVTEECAKQGFQNQVMRKGCESLGLKVDNVPRNSSEGHFCGSCQFGCRTGDKQGVDVTWLVDAVRHGCVIVSGCKAERLRLEENEDSKSSGKGKRCVGVVARSVNRNIGRRIVIEAKVTISACGALSTPPLLIASGLRNKHIGRNLHLHPSMMVWGYFPEGPGPGFEGKMYEGGLITSVHEVKESESEGPCKKTASALIETPALGPSSFAAMCPWESGFQAKERLRKYSRTSHLFCMVRDQGSGEVTKEGRVSFKMSCEDKEKMTGGVKRALRILVAAGVAEVGTYRSDNQRMECEGMSEGELEEFLGEVKAAEGPMDARDWGMYYTAHQMGSCRMGVSEREGAVDEDGESWEAEGLFVCDGSVAPSAVGVNPMVTIQAIAYCIANNLADSMKKKNI